MGSCLSSTNTKVSSDDHQTNNVVRVVHFNGYLESFEDPITVGQVTANVPKHFLCTPSQLVLHDLKPLMPDTKLASGQIYFLLPYSALRFELSHVDLANISKKLSAIAKTGRSPVTSPTSSPKGSIHSEKTSPSASPGRSSPTKSCLNQSPGGGSPNRWYSDKYKIATEKESVVDLQMSKKSPSWKPMLATIKERPANRRTESELLEKYVPKMIVA